VAIGDLDPAESAATAETLGPEAAGFELDVSDRDSFATFLESAEQRVGPLDVLINNARIMPIGPMLDQPAELARRTLEVNVFGAINGMAVAMPGMLERSRGYVVNVASIAGKAPTPGGATYGAKKAAVVSLTETARVEFRGRGVEFTCVMPSFTYTELISGTKGTKLVATVEPADVGEAIARAVLRPRPDVYVPRAVGRIAKTYPLIGRRMRDAMARSIGADRTFLDFDREQRRDYEARITGEPSGKGS
jgi:NAD(P)-dependent dehydrogenase (short-subunit alcohol dehydrogenase family)